MDAKVRCPHCAQGFEPESGRPTVKCPHCGRYLTAAATAPRPIEVAPIRPRVQPPPIPAARAAPASRTPSPGPRRPQAPAGLLKSCPACSARYSAKEHACPECGARYRTAASDQEERTEGAFAPEKKGIAKGVVGGLAMIGIAIVWFVLGYSAGRIFFYPPILALVGVYAVVKGLATGNIAGQPGRRPVRRRGRRPG